MPAEEYEEDKELERLEKGSEERLEDYYTDSEE
jgi:hypothetical protein